MSVDKLVKLPGIGWARWKVISTEYAPDESGKRICRAFSQVLDECARELSALLDAK